MKKFHRKSGKSFIEREFHFFDSRKSFTSTFSNSLETIKNIMEFTILVLRGKSFRDETNKNIRNSVFDNSIFAFEIFFILLHSRFVISFFDAS